MIFNQHSNLKGTHAFLSPSKYYWIKYSKDKLLSSWANNLAVERGVLLHNLARVLITLRIKLPKTKATINMYVNDAIGYRMTPEQTLYYSEYCYGTADAIMYNERTKKLRIHDLKTGTSLAHMEQLEIYAALFYLEYGKRIGFEPTDDNIELRIYQSDQVFVHKPLGNDILSIANTIVEFTEILSSGEEERAYPEYSEILELNGVLDKLQEN